MIGLMKFNLFKKKIQITYEFKREWNKYVGLYQYILYCSDTLYQSVVIEDDKLILNGNSKIELIPISDTEFKTSTGETVIFDEDIMYTTTNTKCIRKDNIVEELVELKKRDPNHRHLTFWMLDMCASNLRKLGKEESAKQIEALKPDK